MRPTILAVLALATAALPPGARAQIVFEPPIVVNGGGVLARVVAVDVDEDGVQDLVVSHGIFGGPVTLQRGLGGGAFAAAVPVPGLSGVFAAWVLADFDGDGHLDLVGSHSGPSSQVRAFVSFGDGHGTFADGHELAGAYFNAVGADAADFDADGLIDIALASGSFGFSGGAILVVKGHGDRTFADAAIVASAGEVVFGAMPAVRAGDVNGDGLDDIVYTGAIGSPVRLSLGNGAFATPPCSDCPQVTDRDFVLADVNGDGSEDVVTCARVLLSLGAGALGVGQVLAPALSPFTVDVADLDGDGPLDVAIARNYTNSELDSSLTFGDVLVLRGRGDGTFETPGLVVSHVPQPRNLVAADVDDDGRPDLVVAEFQLAPASLRVLRNHTYAAGSPYLDLGGALAGAAGAPIQLASGTLVAGEPFSFRLFNGPVGGTAYHIVGLSALNAPFKGGTMIPTPNLINGPLPLDGAGGIDLAGAWIPGTTGLTLWLQFWMPNGGGPHGLVASTGVRAQIP